MQNSADAREAHRSSVNCATLKVETQRRMISAMRLGDPALPFAYALLRQMEQNAAMTAMGHVFLLFEGKQAATE